MLINTLLLVAVVLIILQLPFIRRYILTFPIYYTLKVLNFLPAISQTEREAIEAGSTWVDADLFSGSPNFRTILKHDYGHLSSEEEAFLAGSVMQLCNKVEDWEVYKNRDFSDDIWDI